MGTIGPAQAKHWKIRSYGQLIMNNRCCHPVVPKWLVIGLAVMLFSAATGSDLRAIETKHVLVLHSYHSGMAWSDSVSHGIAAAFQSSDLSVAIESAYMDTKHVASPAYYDQMLAFFRTRFQVHRFDLVISSDDHAFNFLRRHSQALFGDVPVVFCGVNDFEDDMLAGLPRFTGVTESFDILATLNTALDMQPDANRIIAISDRSVSATANQKRLKETIPALKRAVEVITVDDLTMQEVQNYVSRLTPKDILLWLAFTSDRAGQTFSLEESTLLIATHSKAPMYSLWDFNLGHGIVGGRLISGTMQGRQAGEYAIRILKGAAASSLPVIKESPNQFMFDYRQVTRYGIDPRRIPAGSTVLNAPVTLYSKLREFFRPVLGRVCRPGHHHFLSYGDYSIAAQGGTGPGGVQQPIPECIQHHIRRAVRCRLFVGQTRS